MSAPTAPTPTATWFRVGATVAAGRLRPPVGPRRRRAVCGAARVLTGLGVRVEVRAPATAWPRTGTGPLLVSNSATALDPLALLTAVPGAVVAGGPDRLAGVPLAALPADPARVAAALRAGSPVSTCRVDAALLAAALDAGAAVCPVAVRWRGTATPPPPRGSAVAAMRWLAASIGAVVEVLLLPATSPASATPQELATTVAAVLAAPSWTREGWGGGVASPQ
ncbi:hypothetical protein ACU610_14875 [Geodermatophilus sp. URMC 61]|uniref:hypothetical protein n=1 Tax=Geodermatophilus sp. URMC 61 TaxID=3423411 RepID=UPI00406BF245